MNHVHNDYGMFVTAVGSPNSDARLKVEYPKLISQVQSYHNTYGDNQKEKAYLLIRQALDQSSVSFSTKKRILELLEIDQIYVIS